MGAVTLLLDTHALLWAWNASPQLNAAARTAIADRRNHVLVSPVSAFELAIKHRLGKLPDAGPVIAAFAQSVARYEMAELPLTSAHALRAGAYPMTHRDPFDRLLAAPAELDGLTLVTRGPAFADFPVTTLR